MRFYRKILSVIARELKSMGTITHVATSEPVAALTFDDGPNPDFTPRLLDILQRHGAYATFFMVGEAAQRHPELVRRVAQAGHAIGNHSWTHLSFSSITGRERRAQIRACKKAIAPYGQKLFRPPYGQQSVELRFDAMWLGYQIVTWNLVAEDWLGHDADLIVSSLMSKIRPGCIILLHDALYDFTEERYADREPMLRAVNVFLEQVGERFRFVTVPELFKYGRIIRQN